MPEFQIRRTRGQLPTARQSTVTPPPSSSVATLVDALHIRPEGAQPLVDSLVATLDLSDIVDRARSVGAERREQHRHAGANIRRVDRTAAELRRTGNERAMR